MKSRPLKKLVTLAMTLGVAFVWLGAGPAVASAETPSERPRISTDPPLSPVFGLNRSDYAIRCAGAKTTVEVEAPTGWRGAIGRGNLRTGHLATELQLRPNRSFTVRLRHGTNPVKRFHVRCLPADFPEYQFSGHWTGGPRLVVIQMKGRYAVAIDRNGSPIWWFKAPEGSPYDAKFLADGTFAYAPATALGFRGFQIRNLAGRPLRSIEAAGNASTDLHDLILLPNRNYLLGTHLLIRGVDTTRFGGKPDSTINTAQLQEQTPGGRLVWKWNAYPRIGLRETGRWWKTIGPWGEPYDVHHWNSIDRRGRDILLSFRHLDAVYKIDRRTGRIKWKLGGVKTKKSLRVRRDPFRKYPFGGQHDARFQPDGTITALDNASYLKRQQPRAVRYRIQPRKRLATLVDQVRDPKVGVSVGMASARLTGAGWFIGWGAIGANGMAGGYQSGGKPRFRLSTPGGFSYRLNPVQSKRPSLKQLRRAMDRMPAAGP